MKAYGIPRDRVYNNPDKGDIHELGLKTSAGRNDDRSSFRNSLSKRSIRRYWKRRARQKNKELCEETE